MFQNLKVLTFTDCRSDYERRCVSQECPLLAKYDLCDSVDVLASQNEVMPSMKYFECELSKLATSLKVFPSIKILVVMPVRGTIYDFI